MLIVLLSRVKKLEDIYFVGSRAETFKNIKDLYSYSYSNHEYKVIM